MSSDDDGADHSPNRCQHSLALSSKIAGASQQLQMPETLPYLNIGSQLIVPTKYFYPPLENLNRYSSSFDARKISRPSVAPSHPNSTSFPSSLSDPIIPAARTNLLRDQNSPPSRPRQPDYRYRERRDTYWTPPSLHLLSHAQSSPSSSPAQAIFRSPRTPEN